MQNPRIPDPKLRHELCQAFLDASKTLDYLVQQGYPQGLMDFVPDLEGAWSIRAQLVHLLDADLMAHGRIRFAIAEPGTTVLVWDPDLWKSSLFYEKQNVTATLSLLRMQRALTVDMLKQLSDETWQASWSVHPVKGPMNLQDWLELYTGHIRVHLEYIKRNEAAWESQGGSTKSCCNG